MNCAISIVQCAVRSVVVLYTKPSHCVLHTAQCLWHTCNVQYAVFTRKYIFTKSGNFFSKFENSILENYKLKEAIFWSTSRFGPLTPGDGETKTWKKLEKVRG